MMSHELPDLSFRSPKTQVGESAIHGKGLFAREPIGAGEIVAIKGGYILQASEWAALEPAVRDSEIQIAEEFFIAASHPDEREGCMVYLNHSCAPNCALQGQIVFLAMRDIGAGEELTHDWATTDDLDYEMTCNCGAPDCRGTITGKDWRLAELQEKYAGWFSWFIQRKIDRQRSE
ncbi:MAG TPA: SET domain-containing protein-lysine N-methyltransferase [Acidobacteriota bacterium]|nr:SET domain-containing protein-lysine N-methyltransferase [Acidobacteriota bacterium]